LYVDGAQYPVQLDRGIARYVSEHARAIDALAPSVVNTVLLNPDLPLTSNLSAFLGKGRLGWVTGGRPPTNLPRVYHIMSPFEPPTSIDVMWPRWARDSRIATVVTLYDLIPLIFSEQYLVDPFVRTRYMARLDLVRHADGVLAVSEHTAEDAVDRLGVSPERVHVIHAGTSEHFAGMYPSSAAAWGHLSRQLKSVRPGFVLYVGGADFRKNVEGLIAGFARLPTVLRGKHQLVIAGDWDAGQLQLLGTVADREGLGRAEFVVTGRVSDADLGALYRACALFVLPSIYEGFGLPILEAMSCGAPVAASATTTGPEVLGDLEGTFDPNDPDSIAACLSAILSSPDALDRLRCRSRRRVGEYTWKSVAERSVDAYDRAVARTAWRRPRRPRIALVTPWPPEPSRIADYNLRLAAGLARRVDVDVIVGGSVELYASPPGGGVRLIAAREFEQSRDFRRHDRVLYCMGNSELHRHVYELLRRWPGPVVLHDVRLTDFYRWYAGIECPEDPMRALAERIQAMYGDRLPEEAAQGLALAADRQVALGIYMTRELQSYAEQCLVHSKRAREVLALDCRVLGPHVPVSVLPFGLPEAAHAPRGAAALSPLVVSLGFAHEVGAIATLIDAFALLAVDVPTARLVIAVRAGDPAESDRWRGYANEHAPNASIDVPRTMTAERYLRLLRSADLAVQLQPDSGGEALTAVTDCLANGLPTIVTDLGWASELPSHAVAKAPVNVAPGELKDRMAMLLADTDTRVALSLGALDHARACTLSRVADAYLDALGLR
jgi:glycosyltransferase involved in cell wall biosynthesis